MEGTCLKHLTFYFSRMSATDHIQWLHFLVYHTLSLLHKALNIGRRSSLLLADIWELMFSCQDEKSSNTMESNTACNSVLYLKIFDVLISTMSTKRGKVTLGTIQHPQHLWCFLHMHFVTFKKHTKLILLTTWDIWI